MIEVLNALQLINHHVKDLKWILKWLSVCKDPDGKCPEFRQNLGYRSTLADMDNAAYTHYDVQLHAAQNEGYGVMRNMPLIGISIDDVIAGKYCIEEDCKPFVYPDTDDIEGLRYRVSQDYDYIYGVKDICIRYLLFHGDKENVTTRVLTREIRKDGRKLIGVEIIVENKVFRFHNRSEELYNAHPEIPVTDLRKAKFKIYNFSKTEVADALKKIEDFYRSRNIRLPKREVI